MLKIPQSIHQSLAALSKVIRGSQLLTPEVQKLASALLNHEVIKRTHNWNCCLTFTLLTLVTLTLLSLLTLLPLILLTLTLFTLLTLTLLTQLIVLSVFLDFLLSQFLFVSVEFQILYSNPNPEHRESEHKSAARIYFTFTDVL